MTDGSQRDNEEGVADDVLSENEGANAPTSNDQSLNQSDLYVSRAGRMHKPKAIFDL